MVSPAASSSEEDKACLTNGGVKNVYLFTGEEAHSKEKEISRLKGSLLDKGAAELNYNVFYGNDSSAKEILSCLTTMPFLSPRRLVVVRRAEKLSDVDKKLLSDYASNPQHTSCLVLDAKDDTILKDASCANQHVEIVHFDKIPLFKMSGWIKELLRARGKSIGNEALELLRELLGQRGQGILEKEIEKLASFVEPRKEIKTEDVEEIVDKDLVRTTFDITDAIALKDTEKALGILRHISSLSAPRYGDIIGLISWHLKTLLKSRLLLENGKSEFEVTGGLRVPQRLKSSYMSQIKRQRASDIYPKLELLLNTDLDIKTGKAEPKAALEAAIVRLCLG